MEHLADCPICQKITEGKIEKEGIHCCLVLLGSRKVAALKTHENSAMPEALGEAVRFLREHVSSSSVADYSDAPGHWALQLVNAKWPQGQSRGRE